MRTTQPSPRLVLWCVVVAVLAALAFVSVIAFRPMLILTTAGHDDGLYLRLGMSLVQGAWLGPYDQFTLMKGPGFPFFLAAIHWLGIPVSVAQALLHCLAAACLGFVAARLAHSPVLGTLVFMAIVWNPWFLQPRLVREGIYTAQIVLLFAFAVYALFVADSPRGRLAASIAAGVALGWCWLTREEGVLLLPPLLLLLLARWWRQRREPGHARFLLLMVAFLAAGFLAANTAFQARNLRAYGSFIGVDIRERNFVAALDALQSVRAGDEKIFVPVTRAARQRIYAVSPAFASLKEYFDPLGRDTPWSEAGCEIWKWTCGEIASGWFIWALRDAASSTGRYRSPAAASDFFGAVAREVREGCAAGRLRCETSVVPYMPRITAEQVGWLPRELWKGIRMLAEAPAPDPARYGGRSTGDRTQLAQAAIFLNNPVHMPSDYPTRHALAGWYWDGGDDWFSLEVRAGGESMAALVQRQDSPDLVKAFGSDKAARQRFAIDANCRAHCRMTFRTAAAQLDIGFADIMREVERGNRRFQVGKGTLWIDALQLEQTVDLQDPRLATSREVRAGVGRAYAAAAPFFLPLGLAAFAAAAVLAYRRQPPPHAFAALTLAGSLWMLVAVRIVALALIAISSFAAVNSLYMSPALYLAPVAAIVSIGALVAMRRSSHPHAVESEAAMAVPGAVAAPRPAVLLLALLFVLLGVKLWLVGAFGNATPYWDQWDAEAMNLYKPWLEGTLGLGELFAPHNEHRIVLTRLLALGLLAWNGAWNPLAQMAVNAVLHALALVMLVYFAWRASGRVHIGAYVAAAAVAFVIPFGWDNALAGFQSQFYFLLLFSTLALWWTTTAEALSPRWWLGVTCVAAAFLSLASGVVVAIAVLATMLFRAIPRPGRDRRAFIASIVLAALFLAGILLTPSHPGHEGLRAQSVGQFLGTLAGVLAWPMEPGFLAAIVRNLPIVLFVAWMWRRRPPASDARWFLVALGLWALLQAASVAYGRVPESLTSRYLDLFTVAVFANFACLLVLAREAMPSRRVAALAILGVWSLALAGALLAHAGKHVPRELATKREQSLAQESNLRGFLATGRADWLVGKPPRHIPYPGPERLASIVQSPTIRAILPSNLAGSSTLAARRAEERWRSVIGFDFVLLVLGLVCGWLALAPRSSSRR